MLVSQYRGEDPGNGPGCVELPGPRCLNAARPSGPRDPQTSLLLYQPGARLRVAADAIGVASPCASPCTHPDSLHQTCPALHARTPSMNPGMLETVPLPPSR